MKPIRTARASPLASLRAAAGLRQLDLAVRAGVAVGTISFAEAHGVVTPGTAAKLATALGTTPERILAAARGTK